MAVKYLYGWEEAHGISSQKARYANSSTLKLVATVDLGRVVEKHSHLRTGNEASFFLLSDASHTALLRINYVPKSANIQTRGAHGKE